MTVFILLPAFILNEQSMNGHTFLY